MPSDSLSLSAVKALAALAMGREFSLFDGVELAVQVTPDSWVAVADADLAALAERALVTLTGDDESGMPRVLTVTGVGRSYLARWQAINGRLVLNPNVRKGAPNA